jgi:hypothetical protein
MSATHLACAIVVAYPWLAVVGCSNNPGNIDGGADTGASDVVTADTGDGGCALQGLDPTTAVDPGAGKVWVTISGEVNALTGYPFPPDNPVSDTFMPDGWTIQIYEYIVNVDHITLWSNPNVSPTDQSQHGSIVAQLDGPFVVDLHKGGKIIGQGGAPEEATPLGQIVNQNMNGGASFDPTMTYAFGFSTVPASCGALNVNLTPDELADYNLMVQNGYSVFYSGVATWNGDASAFGCTQTSAGAGPDAGIADGGSPTYVDGGYDFSAASGYPQQMFFKLGFSTPTNYVNCQNETLQGTPIGGEDYPRGIQISPSQSVFAQVTVHMDHPFWESFAENSPVHWDQIASQYIGIPTPTAMTEDLKGVPFYAFTDSKHVPLPWRNCMGMYYTPPGNGQMAFSTLSVPVNPTGTCTGTPGQDYTKDNCPAIRDYYDYIRFTQSTQGHLNSQGLCFIDRQYPAPAGGS